MPQQIDFSATSWDDWRVVLWFANGGVVDRITAYHVERSAEGNLQMSGVVKKLSVGDCISAPTRRQNRR